ncbi:MAG: 3-deoxy-D-manno-octulosonic acid transferase [Chlamydiae bacterium]|nr:3-deoxy-D-manno-octulosonic acid transferase [Chlamydiota bacterium]
MIHFFYQAFFFCALLFMFLHRLFSKKRRDLHLKDRLGFSFTPTTSDFTIWLHCVSVGETKAVKALYKKLKEAYPNAHFVITNQTVTGHKIAQKELRSADQYRFFPMDFGIVVKSVIKKVKPNLFITAETDIWPKFLQETKKQGCFNFVVNAKMSQKTYKRLKRMPFFARFLYKHMDLILAQSDTHKKRFLDLKIKCPIEVIGNLKCDPTNYELKNFNREMLGLNKDDFVIVVGSTHDPEEKLLLDIFKNLIKSIENIRIFLVPRHPERFNEVEEMLISLPYTRLSKGNFAEEKIILVDQMGKLDALYQIADISIVAGSFTEKVGGHNILEPIFAKSALFFGPHMHGQQELEELVLQANAGLKEPLNQLAETLQE